MDSKRDWNLPKWLSYSAGVILFGWAVVGQVAIRSRGGEGWPHLEETVAAAEKSPLSEEASKPLSKKRIWAGER